MMCWFNRQILSSKTFYQSPTQTNTLTLPHSLPPRLVVLVRCTYGKARHCKCPLIAGRRLSSAASHDRRYVLSRPNHLIMSSHTLITRPVAVWSTTAQQHWAKHCLCVCVCLPSQLCGRSCESESQQSPRGDAESAFSGQRLTGTVWRLEKRSRVCPSSPRDPIWLAAVALALLLVLPH